MIHAFEVEGAPYELDVPDDATPEEIDALVNQYVQGSEPAPAPEPDNPKGTFGDAMFSTLFGTRPPDRDIPPERDIGGMSPEEKRQLAQGKLEAGEVDTVTSPVMPRTTSLPPDASFGRKATSIYSDIASLTGRAGDSVKRPEGESFGDALKDTEGKGAISRIVRSPATATGMALGPLAGKALGLLAGKAAGPFAALASKAPLLGKALGAGVTGAAEAIPSAAAGQAERYAETGEVDPLEAGLEVAGGAGFGMLGEGLKAAGKRFYQSLMETGKGGTTALRNRFDPQTILDYNLEGSTTQVAKKARDIASKAGQEIDQIVDAANDAAGNANAIDLAMQTMDEMKEGGRLYNLIPAGNAANARSALERVYGEMAEHGLDGPLDLKGLRRAKAYLRKGKTFAKGTVRTEDDKLVDAVRKEFYYRVADRMAEMANAAGHDVTEANKLYHTMSTVADAAEAAGERVGKHAPLGPYEWIALGSTAISAGAMHQDLQKMLTTLGVGLAVASGKQVLGSGRGAGLLVKGGKFAGSVPKYLGGLITEAVPSTTEEDDEELRRMRRNQ